MNQLENKVRNSKNDNGSQLAGVETPGERQAVEERAPAEHSREHARAQQARSDPHFSLRSLRAEAEIYAISRTLEYTGWNRRRAAQLLSISYRGILYKIRQHNLTPGPGRAVVSSLDQTVKVD